MTNALNWFEIPVTNLAKSAAFYGAMLDTTLKQMDFLGVPHAIFMAEEPAVSGTLIEDPKRRPTRGTGTVVYLNARDGVDRCLARAVEAGAKIVTPATAIGEQGIYALIEDLDGNVVGLHQGK